MSPPALRPCVNGDPLGVPHRVLLLGRSTSCGGWRGCCG
jgi:hypothetical protein